VMQQPGIRRRTGGGSGGCALSLHPARNAATLGGEGVISAPDSAIRALVVTADEERIIAHETAACLAHAGAGRR